MQKAIHLVVYSSTKIYVLSGDCSTLGHICSSIFSKKIVVSVALQRVINCIAS